MGIVHLVLNLAVAMQPFSSCVRTLSITELIDELLLKTNETTIFDGKASLFSIPNSAIAAVITLDWNTTLRKSLFGLYDDDAPAVTLRQFMTVQSASMLQMSLLDFPEKNLEKIS